MFRDDSTKNLLAKCTVGRFKRHGHVKNPFESKPIRMMFSPYGIFGSTWKPLAVFLLGYLAMTIFFYYVMPYEKDCPQKAQGIRNANPTEGNANAWTRFICAVITKEGFKKSVVSWKESSKIMIKVLSLLLGFYISTMMKRWWSQVCNIPIISDLAIALNSSIYPGTYLRINTGSTCIYISLHF